MVNQLRHSKDPYFSSFNFFKYLILRERDNDQGEGLRERILSSRQSVSCQHKNPTWDSNDELQDHDLSQNQEPED